MIAIIVSAEASPIAVNQPRLLDRAKFRDPLFTAGGADCAQVTLRQLEALWVNTDTLCNLSCKSSYIKSFPTNDALVNPTLFVFGIDAFDPAALVLFPEIDDAADVPEISEECWDTLGKSPGSMMCSSSRIVAKRPGSARAVVVACKLIPCDDQFALGEMLAGAHGAVSLNPPHCARFCVIRGASCSG